MNKHIMEFVAKSLETAKALKIALLEDDSVVYEDKDFRTQVFPDGTMKSYYVDQDNQTTTNKVGIGGWPVI